MISGNLKVSYVLFQCRRRSGAVVYNCFIKKLFQKYRPTSHEIIFVEVPFNKVTDLDLIKNKVPHSCFAGNVTKFLRTAFCKSQCFLDCTKSAQTRNAKITFFLTYCWVALEFSLKILTKGLNDYFLHPQVLLEASKKGNNPKSTELCFARFFAFVWKF